MPCSPSQPRWRCGRPRTGSRPRRADTFVPELARARLQRALLRAGGDALRPPRASSWPPTATPGAWAGLRGSRPRGLAGVLFSLHNSPAHASRTGGPRGRIADLRDRYLDQLVRLGRPRRSLPEPPPAGAPLPCRLLVLDIPLAPAGDGVRRCAGRRDHAWHCAAISAGHGRFARLLDAHLSTLRPLYGGWAQF